MPASEVKAKGDAPPKGITQVPQATVEETLTELRGLQRAIAQREAEQERIRQEREAKEQARAELEAEALEANEKRIKFWARTAAATIATVLGGGGLVGYEVATEEPPPTLDTSEIEKIITPVVQEQERAEVARRNLAGRILVNESVTVEGMQYLGSQIKAAHPRQIDEINAVEKPPVLDAAEKRNTKRKQKAAVEKLLQQETDDDLLGNPADWRIGESETNE